jgi:hypothetical protein
VKTKDFPIDRLWGFAGIRGVWVDFLANSDREDSAEAKPLTLCWDRFDRGFDWGGGFDATAEQARDRRAEAETSSLRRGPSIPKKCHNAVKMTHDVF